MRVRVLSFAHLRSVIDNLYLCTNIVPACSGWFYAVQEDSAVMAGKDPFYPSVAV